MADIRQEENGMYDVCTTLKEYEDMFASKGSKANEHNGQVISTDNQIDIVLQDQNKIINLAEKINEIDEKGPDDQAQSALNPVPEPNAEAFTEDTAGTDQIGATTTPAPEAIPVPAEPKRPPKRKRGRRVRYRWTRTIAVKPSPEPELKDNRKRRPGRPKVTDDDDWLPPDWVVRTDTRQNGATTGRKDKACVLKCYVSPEGRRFRSRMAAENHINRSTTRSAGK